MGFIQSKSQQKKEQDILDHLDDQIDLDLDLENDQQVNNMNNDCEDVFIDQDHFFMNLKQHIQVENTLGIFYKKDNSFMELYEMYSDFATIKQIKNDYEQNQLSNFQNITSQALKKQEILNLRQNKTQSRVKKFQDFVTITKENNILKNINKKKQSVLISQKSNKNQFIYKGTYSNDKQILKFEFENSQNNMQRQINPFQKSIEQLVKKKYTDK